MLCRPLISSYFPTSDDLAFEATSTPAGGPVDPRVWVAQGFHGYFMPYPEWQSLNSDIWRPPVNALYWIHHELFGSLWWSRLVAGYLAHGMTVGLVTYIALAEFSLTPLLAALAALMATLNPGLWSIYASPNEMSYALQLASFQTEILCTLLMLLAFIAFLEERLAAFALISFCALCLKETALTVPVSALVLTAARGDEDRVHRLRDSLYLVAPVVVWLAAKSLLFEYGMRGPAHGISDAIHNWVVLPIRHLLLWPTGLYTSPVRQTADALKTLDWRAFSWDLFGLATNFLWWGVLIFALRRALSMRMQQGGARKPDVWVCGLVFALGNLAFVIAWPPTQVRYGYFWFALGPAALFAALSALPSGRRLAVVMTLVLGVPQILTIASSLSSASLEHYRLVKESGRQLIGLLHDLPPQVKIAYLVDDTFISPAAPYFAQRLSGFRGELIMVNSLTPAVGCREAADASTRYRLRQVDGATELDYLSPPSCMAPNWYDMRPDILSRGPEVPRGPWLHYNFPELTRSNGTSSAQQYDVGSSWSVRTDDPRCSVPGACVWFGLSRSQHRYFPLAAEDDRAAHFGSHFFR
jgi:hypothetical protein